MHTKFGDLEMQHHSWQKIAVLRIRIRVIYLIPNPHFMITDPDPEPTYEVPMLPYTWIRTALGWNAKSESALIDTKEDPKYSVHSFQLYARMFFLPESSSGELFLYLLGGGVAQHGSRDLHVDLRLTVVKQ